MKKAIILSVVVIVMLVIVSVVYVVYGDVWSYAEMDMGDFTT